MQIQLAHGLCSLGHVLIATTERGICSIMLGDSREELEAKLQQRFPEASFHAADPQTTDWIQTVINYLEHPTGSFDLPLDIQGTAFQQRVWAVLRTIPVGQQIFYSELAQRLDAPKAVRAVAQACGANKLAVVIPCHRVVRSNGELGGYRWGLERKRQLLDRESNQATLEI